MRIAAKHLFRRQGSAKRNKNNAADAEAICEAVRRPTMRFVQVKSAEQQGQLMQHRTRDVLIRQRTHAAWRRAQKRQHRYLFLEERTFIVCVLRSYPYIEGGTR